MAHCLINTQPQRVSSSPMCELIAHLPVWHRCYLECCSLFLMHLCNSACDPASCDLSEMFVVHCTVLGGAAG